MVGKRKFNNNTAIMKVDGTISMEFEEVETRYDEYIGELLFYLWP